MPTNLKRIRRFSCVVEALPPQGFAGREILDLGIMEDCLKSFRERSPCEWWAILHNHDVLDDGTFKRPHWHIVIESVTKHTTTGIVRDLADCLGVNDNRVSVRECMSLIASIRYLIHIDDPDKYCYVPFDVITTDKAKFIEALNRNDDDVTIEEVISICRDSNDVIDVMKRLGLKNYQRYRTTIKDVLFYQKKI